MGLSEKSRSSLQDGRSFSGTGWGFLQSFFCQRKESSILFTYDVNMLEMSTLPSSGQCAVIPKLLRRYIGLFMLWGVHSRVSTLIQRSFQISFLFFFLPSALVFVIHSF